MESRIKRYLEYLDNVENSLEFEVAYIIKQFEDYTDEEITNEKIKKVYEYLSDTEEIFTNDLVIDIIKILE